MPLFYLDQYTTYSMATAIVVFICWVGLESWIQIPWRKKASS